jgi:hypothetical protein
MAGSSLLALIDDIASILDDVAAMSKTAMTKTTGVLGDDLALSAQQVAGIRADRELPVVWAVGLGSLRNKAILVPAALAISAFAPWMVILLLMLGGAFLCYEGFEKLAERFLHGKEALEARHGEHVQALADPDVDMLAFEKDKIRGAVRTDLVLSIEVIVITLGTVAGAPLGQQLTVLTGVAILITVGVYGVVAAIVKLDDGGLWLATREGQGAAIELLRGFGRLVLKAAPWLMKTLSVVGTAAMFMVGGGILIHGLPMTHDLIHPLVAATESLPGVGGILASLLPLLLDVLVGILAGALILLAMTLGGKAWAKLRGK